MKYIIGSDECLKGDTFGGIVVASVAANDKLREELRMMGVADSKKLTDKRILELAPRIMKLCPHAIKDLFPQEYNCAPKLTVLLNDLHNAVATHLREELVAHECVHVVDAYPGCAAGDIRITHAEDQYVEVAAASIIARAAALSQIELLSKNAGFTVPKGSTHVAGALQRIKQSGKDPALFVKLHFKNVQEALRK